MPLLYLATSAELPELSPDCRLLPPALEAIGWEVELVVWDDPSVDWSRPDGVVVRSIWDYYRKRPAFEAWLGLLEDSPASVANPPHVLRANLDKRYLGHLAEAGAATVPTSYVETVEAGVAAVIERGWDEVVVKPTVNAAGRNTHRVRSASNSTLESALASALQAGEVMVQPFLDEVLEEGEWSLLYFGGDYSHSVRKRAAPGEFRVQDDWGGSVHFEAPPAAAHAAAPGILAAAREVFDVDRLPYARIDGLVADGAFLLMELELIEPELFLRADPEAPRRCADALNDFLRRT